MHLHSRLIIFAREVLGLSNSTSIECFPMGKRGSERTFFRLKWNRNDSAILIHYDPRREENSLYPEIALFLNDINVSVPRLIHHDKARCIILIEDLGKIDLWSLRKIPWEKRRLLYQKTLILANIIHSFPEKDFPFNHVKLMGNFTPDLYRWEHDYFKHHFVKDFCDLKIDSTFQNELDIELSALAQRLSESNRSLIHRDLQSQNVMVKEEEPFLIDFQGMRFGNPLYDLGSLLCDPYVNFSNNEREELLSFYYKMNKWNLDYVTYENSFWEASAQRLMQCLGAYGFLGLKRGHKNYLEHIPTGINNLCLATSKVLSLPNLHELSISCKKAIDQAYFKKL